MKRVFGNAVMGSLKVKPTLITAYDVKNRQARVFKNDRESYNNLRLWEVCRASAAAPTYFPSYSITLEGKSLPLVDGGVVANNPTACAIAEAVRVNSPKDNPKPCKIENFVVASFGTGESTRAISESESREWGVAEWAIPIVDVLFDGSADSVDYIASQLIEEENYFRFQTRLEDAYDDLDNADKTNIHALSRLAKSFLGDEGQESMESLVERLNA